MKPTEQQLKDPQWWDDNAPSDEHVLLVSAPDEALITWAKILGGGDFVNDNGTIYQNSRLFNIYKRPVEEAKFIPKVGEWCEILCDYVLCGNHPTKVLKGSHVEVKAIVDVGYGDVALIANEHISGTGTIIFSQLCPIKSERDVFIYCTSEAICGASIEQLDVKGNIRRIAGILFDAGFKAPETNDE